MKRFLILSGLVYLLLVLALATLDGSVLLLTLPLVVYVGAALLFGPDGAAFSPSHTRKGGRLYRYYVSQTVLKHGAGSCPVGRVPAGDI